MHERYNATAKHTRKDDNMASMEERIASVESAFERLATKADVKRLDARLTRAMYAVGAGVIISIAANLIGIALTLL